ncbi:MAG: hypothetical protein KJO35_00235, partial [Gammaproteobacteria bacterium]|nr:hypothetical protein [Gammaproteobacteria bacterium]
MSNNAEQSYRRPAAPGPDGPDHYQAGAGERPLAMLYAARRHAGLVFLVTLVVTALAVAAAFLMTPVYRVQTLVAPVGDEDSAVGGLSDMMGQFGGLASLAGVSIGGQDEAHKAIATLESRSFTEDFIRDENLLPVLFAGDWDAENEQWTIDDADDIPSLWDGYKLFRDEIRNVSLDPQTRMVTLTIDWEDPVEAARWANEMIARLNNKIKNQTIEESQKTIDYLNTEL